MTVTGKAMGVGYACQWFEGTELRHGAFPAEALEVLQQGQSSSEAAR